QRVRISSRHRPADAGTASGSICCRHIDGRNPSEGTFKSHLDIDAFIFTNCHDFLLPLSCLFVTLPRVHKTGHSVGAPKSSRHVGINHHPFTVLFLVPQVPDEVKDLLARRANKNVPVNHVLPAYKSCKDQDQHQEYRNYGNYGEYEVHWKMYLLASKLRQASPTRRW